MAASDSGKVVLKAVAGNGSITIAKFASWLVVPSPIYIGRSCTLPGGYSEPGPTLRWGEARSAGTYERISLGSDQCQVSMELGFSRRDFLSWLWCGCLPWCLFFDPPRGLSSG